MKNIRLFALVIATAFIFASCDKCNEVDTTQNNEQLNKISASEFLSFDSNLDVMSPSGNTKAKSQIKTMWDAYQEVVNYSVDPEKEAEYQQAIEQYSSILKPIGNNEYEMIISDPIVAQKFNSNGVLAIGNNIYIAEVGKITKYAKEDGIFKLVKEFNRPFEEIQDIEIDSSSFTNTTKSAQVITKTGEWTSDSYSIKVSRRRRIRVWMYAETYGDIGASVGAKSKYYRKHWKDKKGDNRLEFKCSELTYTNSSGISKTINNETAMSNTKDRVHLYAANRYVNMNGNKEYSITNPIVKFWRSSTGSGTAYVFDDFH
ncbi:hypothetical protein [Labilibaculum euxinus]